MKPLQVYLDEDIHKELKRIALDQGISLSEFVRLALQQPKQVLKAQPQQILPNGYKNTKECPVHKIPMTLGGKCMQKGCKYA